MPKFKFPKISTNFAQAIASTIDATTRGIERNPDQEVRNQSSAN
jgi:hypothetical protein